ncbi:MAG: hypothetical protein AAGI37_13955 [Planctomycetota bacterium]
MKNVVIAIFLTTLATLIVGCASQESKSDISTVTNVHIKLTNPSNKKSLSGSVCFKVPDIANGFSAVAHSYVEKQSIKQSGEVGKLTVLGVQNAILPFNVDKNYSMPGREDFAYHGKYYALNERFPRIDFSLPYIKNLAFHEQSDDLHEFFLTLIFVPKVDSIKCVVSIQLSSDGVASTDDGWYWVEKEINWDEVTQKWDLKDMVIDITWSGSDHTKPNIVFR